MIPPVSVQGYFLVMQTAGKKLFEPLPPTAALPDEVMDYKGAAAYLKMAAGTLRHKVMKGSIPFFKIGSSVRFSKNDIDAWLKEHRKTIKRHEEKDSDCVVVTENGDVHDRH
jgi:excisionase family DNA binding protein